MRQQPTAAGGLLWFWGVGQGAGAGDRGRGRSGRGLFVFFSAFGDPAVASGRTGGRLGRALLCQRGVRALRRFPLAFNGECGSGLASTYACVVAAPVDRIEYSPCGVAFAEPAGDVDDSGVVDTNDLSLVALFPSDITSGSYAAEYDFNRDGLVDETDADFIYSAQLGAGAGVMPGQLGDSRALSGGLRLNVGYCGYIFNDDSYLYTVRFRHYSAGLGRWLERDPAGYVDGLGLYEYVRSTPALGRDPLGLQSCSPCPPTPPSCTYAQSRLEKLADLDRALNRACGTAPSMLEVADPFIMPSIEVLGPGFAEQLLDHIDSGYVRELKKTQNTACALVKHYGGKIPDVLVEGIIKKDILKFAKHRSALKRLVQPVKGIDNALLIRDFLQANSDGDIGMQISCGLEFLGSNCPHPLIRLFTAAGTAGKTMILVYSEHITAEAYREMNSNGNCKFLQGIRLQIVEQYRQAKAECDTIHAMNKAASVVTKIRNWR